MANIDNKIAFGNRVRYIRRKNKMTQEDLADRISMSSRNISDIENGKVDCHFTTIVLLAEAFEMTIPELFLDDSEE